MFQLLIGCLLTIFIGGCGPTQWPGLPALPQKNWLKTDNRDSHVPPDPKLSFYSPDKSHTVDDLVWIAIQQSPRISKGMINLEISEINKTDAQWRYLPEMHLRYTITTNVTRYNQGDKRNMGKDYGKTAYQTNFSGFYHNPVETFLSVKAADELLQTAIVTQRKLIGDVIYLIFKSMFNIRRLESVVANLQESSRIADNRAKYFNVREQTRSNVARPASFAADTAEELNLQLHEAKLELVDERLALKSLIGLEPDQALKLDLKSLDNVLAAINPEKMDWKQTWTKTENNYLLRQQVNLESANILLAWANYLPNIGIYVDESPPNGQSQPASAKTDRFAHFTLDFPLLDWGRRWRNADRAEARRRQSQLTLIEEERAYGDSWRRMALGLEKAIARQERMEKAAENGKKRLNAAQTAFENGRLDYALLSDFSQTDTQNQLNIYTAKQSVDEAKLSWIHLASGLTNYYLGQAGYEKASQ